MTTGARVRPRRRAGPVRVGGHLPGRGVGPGQRGTGRRDRPRAVRPVQGPAAGPDRGRGQRPARGRLPGRLPGLQRVRAGAAARRGPRPAEPSRTPAPAWPLLPAELPVWADVVAAAVLSSPPGPVLVTGVGDHQPYDLGDRDLTGLPALRQASGQALARPGRAGTSRCWNSTASRCSTRRSRPRRSGPRRPARAWPARGSPRVNPDGGSAPGSAPRPWAWSGWPGPRPGCAPPGRRGPGHRGVRGRRQVQAAVVLEGAWNG